MRRQHLAHCTVTRAAILYLDTTASISFYLVLQTHSILPQIMQIDSHRVVVVRDHTRGLSACCVSKAWVVCVAKHALNPGQDPCGRHRFAWKMTCNEAKEFNINDGPQNHLI